MDCFSDKWARERGFNLRKGSRITGLAPLFSRGGPSRGPGETPVQMLWFSAIPLGLWALSRENMGFVDANQWDAGIGRIRNGSGSVKFGRCA